MISICNVLDRWATLQPDAPLFSYRNRNGTFQRVSYATFSEKTQILAGRLCRQRYRHGDRALLIHPTGIELLIALIACCRTGLIPIVIPAAMGGAWRQYSTQARIAAIVSDSCPVTLIGKADQSDLAQDPCFAKVRNFLASDAVDFVEPIKTDLPHEVALIQYTSGSTDVPKGVCVTHANAIANAESLLDHSPIGVSWLPQFHDMGLIGFGLFPIIKGGSAVLFPSSDFLRKPALWLQYLSEERATFAAAPNFAYRRCLEAGQISESELRDVDLSALRVMINGAEPVEPQICRAFYDRFKQQGLASNVLVGAYGLAEATLAVTRGSSSSMLVDSEAMAKQDMLEPATLATPSTELNCCGPVLDNVAISIRHNGHPCAPGVVGEIWLNGPSISPGYWKKGRRRPGQWLKTGDLGALVDGLVYITGRKRELIIRRGENFHPHDIEAGIRAEFSLRQPCIVVQRQDGAILLLFEDIQHRSSEFAQMMAQRIERACGLNIDELVIIPRRSIVRTTSGKLARQQTYEQLVAGAITPLCHHVFKTSGDRSENALGWLRRVVTQSPDLAKRRIADIGMDSLRLISLQLEIEELMCVSGIGDTKIDGSNLQALRCDQLLMLVCNCEDGQRNSATALSKNLLAAADRERTREQAQLERDAQKPITWTTQRSALERRKDDVLLTGATGFLGPHLLIEFLEQSSARITALVRGQDDYHARDRVMAAIARAGLANRAARADIDHRLEIWQADLGRKDLGLSQVQRKAIANTSFDIVHNGALVDYVKRYSAMRAVNVQGTRRLLDFAARGPSKRFHHISSTFIFGWTRQGVLHEKDGNTAMEALDFGYSQSKWVAERLVRKAAEQGLATNVFRPSLISVSAGGYGDRQDVAARLLAFMIRHRIAVDTPNQISLLPVDTVAYNLVAIAQRPIGRSATFHATARDYYSLTGLVRQIEKDFGFEFSYLPIGPFVSQLNALAQPDDPVFPLLDFFTHAAPHIAAMSLKRYDNSTFRLACATISGSKTDPSLAEIAQRMVSYLDAEGWIDAEAQPEKTVESVLLR